MLKGGSRRYWFIQIFGWGIVAVYWSYYQINWSSPTLLDVISVLLPYLMIILYTYFYRNLAHKNGWIHMTLRPLIKIILIAWLSMTFLYISITYVSAQFTKGGLGFDPFLGVLTGGIRYSAIWLLAFHFYHLSRQNPNNQIIDSNLENDLELDTDNSNDLPKQILIKDGEEYFHIQTNDIVLFESYGNYVKIHSNEGVNLSKNSLSSIEKRARPNHFFRANRKELINMDKIKNIGRTKNDKIQITLSNEHKVLLSDRKSVLFKELMKL